MCVCARESTVRARYVQERERERECCESEMCARARERTENEAINKTTV